jgi:hypothetical protein
VLPFLLACATAPTSAPLPPGVPADAVVLRVVDGSLTVGPTAVGPWSDLDRSPTDDDDPVLARALAAVTGKPLLVELPPDTMFWKVRKVLGSAKVAETGPVWLSAGKEAFPLAASPRYGLGGTCAEPVPVSGARPLVTLSLQTGADGAWVLASARFLPQTPKGPVQGLPDECLHVPGCDAVYPEGPLREACALGAGGAPERVGLGGELGCVLPIAKAPEQVATWRKDLPAVIGQLGLGGQELLVVMPEARTRYDAVLAVLGGFTDAGHPAPAVGFTLLVEGNDGPPVCNAPVRTAAALEEAGARWVGAHVRPAEAPDGR